MSAFENEWEKVYKEAWAPVWEEFEKFDSEISHCMKVGMLTRTQAGALKGFTGDLKNTLRGLEALEKEIVSQGSDPESPDWELIDRFKMIFTTILSLPLSDLPLKEGQANRMVNKIWGLALRTITGFLEWRAKNVGVDSWSLGATIGFPSGVSGTVVVTFKRGEARTN